jgi:phosphoribosylaminoimidazole carboxylase
VPPLHVVTHSFRVYSVYFYSNLWLNALLARLRTASSACLVSELRYLLLCTLNAVTNRSLGGGQYGRLLSEAASRLSIPVLALDPSAASPAKQISAVSLLHPTLAHVEGSYSDSTDINTLAERVDVLTVEIEHVDVQALFQIRDRNRSTGGHLGKGVTIFPSPETIAIVQDKLSQKLLLQKAGIPVVDFIDLPKPGTEQITEAAKTLGLPLLLKARKNAYDGRGNFLLRDLADIPRGLDALGGPTRELYAERYASFLNEITVVVVRDVNGEIRSYPAVENVHQGKIGHLVRAPLRQGGKDVSARALSLAKKAIESLGDGAVGVFGVEFFLTSDGKSCDLPLIGVFVAHLRI